MKIEGLEYFVGKICTVFTVPTNRDFKSENPQTFPQPVFHYFVGKVREVNSRGIFLEQWNNEKKLRTFFFMDHIVSISEEEVLDPSNPKDKQIIEDYKKTNESSMKKANDNVEILKKQKADFAENPYIDIGDLSSLSGLAKSSL
jgi:hypothetical protein